MNNEKQIAQAILDAQKMREESYLPCIDSQGNDFGEYSKDVETCLITTCKKNNLSSNMWSLLCLANHWYNDIQLWAEDVLADKNILEEAEKEHAKMRDEMKCIGDMDDREEDAYNNSPEIADENETDSDGNLLDSHRI